jgi:hypothetical protein
MTKVLLRNLPGATDESQERPPEYKARTLPLSSVNFVRWCSVGPHLWSCKTGPVVIFHFPRPLKWFLGVASRSSLLDIDFKCFWGLQFVCNLPFAISLSSLTSNTNGLSKISSRFRIGTVTSHYAYSGVPSELHCGGSRFESLTGPWTLWLKFCVYVFPGECETTILK